MIIVWSWLWCPVFWSSFGLPFPTAQAFPHHKWLVSFQFPGSHQSSSHLPFLSFSIVKFSCSLISFSKVSLCKNSHTKFLIRNISRSFSVPVCLKSRPVVLAWKGPGLMNQQFSQVDLRAFRATECESSEVHLFTSWKLFWGPQYLMFGQYQSFHWGHWRFRFEG